MLILIVIGLAFRLINGQFSIWEATLLTNELSFAWDAINEFWNIILPSVLLGALGIGLLLVIRPVIHANSLITALLFLPLLLPLGYLLVARGGYWITHFSLPMKVPAALIYVARNPVYEGGRHKVQLEPEVVDKKHIILLVDESIRGDYLTINNPQEATTPYLASMLTNNNWHNFGVISSMTNCSATANLLLRSGVTAKQLPHNSDALFSQPDLFQYANKAGFRSHYFDAQVKGKRFNNLLTRRDISRIDNYIALKNHFDLDDFQLDHRLALLISKVIKNSDDQGSFIYVNKAGTHFPYQRSYPMTNVDRSRIDHYRHALRWNVDMFFRRLTEGLKEVKDNVLIVYTSDHGQGLGERGNHSTHCLPANVPDEQARVPLVVATLNYPTPAWLRAKPGQYSQFQIFSSLLRSMGYRDLPENYDIDLSQPWPGERFFLSGDLTGRGQLSRNRFIKTESTAAQ